LGSIWFETRQAKGSDPEWSKYDTDFYLNEYKSFIDKKKTKADITKDVLARTYTSGKQAGKTVEQNYIEDYQKLSGGK
jgi:hypothetical protein